MKKIFLLFVAICAFAACNPTQENISNGGHITADELKAKASVTLDIDPVTGKNGNIVTCSTSAPVNARWTIAGKNLAGNYVTKKMRLGEYVITLTGLCADGTEVSVDFPVNCEVETDPIKKRYFYGEDPVKQPEFWLEPGDAAGGRFSDNEGKYFPYLDGETYFGKKTLVFEITEAEDGKFIWGDDYGCTVRVMNGWWSTTYADNVPLEEGYWELEITDQIANECAASADGGEGRDLDLLMTRGRVKIKACYYEY